MIRSVHHDFSEEIASLPAELADAARMREQLTPDEEAAAAEHIARAREQLREQHLSRKRGEPLAAMPVSSDEDDEL